MAASTDRLQFRICRIAAALVGVAAFLCSASPLDAQLPVVIHGRVEDASSRQPIAAARVLAADSSAAVFTDSVGNFAIPIAAGGPLAVHVEQYGYLSQRFDLDEEARFSISVLLLEPAPIVLEGIDVVEESAVTTLLRDLNSRRNFYPGSLRVFDKPRLERFAAVGSVWDLIRQRVPQVFECSAGKTGLCVRGRTRSLQNPNPEVPILVCVDRWESWGAVTELSSLDIESIALLEIYGHGRGGIRVYTAGYLAHSARTGRFIATPLRFGC